MKLRVVLTEFDTFEAEGDENFIAHCWRAFLGVFKKRHALCDCPDAATKGHFIRCYLFVMPKGTVAP